MRRGHNPSRRRPDRSGDSRMSLSPLRLRLLIASLLTVSFLGALDHTIVATSLATIAGELGALQQMSWVVVGYTLASTVLLPVLGKLGDLVGAAPRVPDVARRVPRRIARLRVRAGHDPARHRPGRAGHELGGPPADVADDHRPGDDAPRAARSTSASSAPPSRSRSSSARVLGGAHHRLLGLALGVLDQHPVRPRGARASPSFAVPHIEPGVRAPLRPRRRGRASRVAFVALVLAVTLGRRSGRGIRRLVVAFVVAAIGFAAFFAIELRVSEPHRAAAATSPTARSRRASPCRPIIGDRAVLGHRRTCPRTSRWRTARPRRCRGSSHRDGVRDAGLATSATGWLVEPHRPLPGLPDRRHRAAARSGCSSMALLPVGTPLWVPMVVMGVVGIGTGVVHEPHRRGRAGRRAAQRDRHDHRDGQPRAPDRLDRRDGRHRRRHRRRASPRGCPAILDAVDAHPAGRASSRPPAVQAQVAAALRRRAGAGLRRPRPRLCRRHRRGRAAARTGGCPTSSNPSPPEHPHPNRLTA